MLVAILKIVIPFLIIFNIIPLLIWVERKGSAYIQDRRGPNRANFFGVRLGGLIHSLADVVKLMSKEDIVPDHVNKPFFFLAPFVALFIACVTYAVIPFGHPLTLPSGEIFTLQPADVNVGILYILSMSSLGVFGVMLAGWAANNKYALLGGVRSSAQMCSYEISLGLSVVSVLMMSGSVEFHQIVLKQTAMPWNWYFVYQPLACLLFIVAVFAETNRNPFDLPEGESEIVAGYHTEYSSMKFAMFFMAEYAHMIIASALISLLFFGGWQVPFLSTQVLRDNAELVLFVLVVSHGLLLLGVGAYLLSRFQRGYYGDKRDYEVLVVGFPLLILGLFLTLLSFYIGSIHLGDFGSQIVAAVAQFGTFIGKILFFCWLFIWVRWTLPRFRYDQLMYLGWKVMIPLSLINLAITGVVLLFI